MKVKDYKITVTVGAAQLAQVVNGVLDSVLAQPEHFGQASGGSAELSPDFPRDFEQRPAKKPRELGAWQRC